MHTSSQVVPFQGAVQAQQFKSVTVEILLGNAESWLVAVKIAI